MTAAMFAPSWNAPSEVAPSPNSATATASDPLSRSPQASPAACGTCVAIGTQIDATFTSSRAPPAGRVAPPPLEDRRGRQPAQEPDRRLAVAREDPVAPLERVDRAGLDRLVAPEDRVRPDPALAVVDDRPLVVRPQQDERAMEREQRVVVEPGEPPVGLAVDPDHARQPLLDGARAAYLK